MWFTVRLRVILKRYPELWWLLEYVSVSSIRISDLKPQLRVRTYVE